MLMNLYCNYGGKNSKNVRSSCAIPDPDYNLIIIIIIIIIIQAYETPKKLKFNSFKINFRLFIVATIGILFFVSAYWVRGQF